MATIDAICMVCTGPECDFEPRRIKRRPVGDHDVLIEMKYCGMCHTDVGYCQGYLALGMGKPDYKNGVCPGHELAGIATQVGRNVTKIKVGDQVGVGCMKDACLKCFMCKRGDENYCIREATLTYGGKNKHGRASVPDGDGITKGGYSSKEVVHEHFCIKIPQSYPLEKAGPIMCAGITMYEPMKKWKLKAGQTLGVIGLGGLGVTGIKIGRALGCQVVAISRNDSKTKHATEAGATGFIAMNKEGDLKQYYGKLDLILNTIPVNHDALVYNPLLKSSGKQIMLGVVPMTVAAFVCDMVACGSTPMSASGIGGIANTQEVIDLCTEHKIYPDTKLVTANEIHKVFEIQDKGNDDGVRFVLDIQGSLTEATFSKIDNGPAPKFGGYTPELTGGKILGNMGSIFGRYIACGPCGQRFLALAVGVAAIGAMYCTI